MPLLVNFIASLVGYSIERTTDEQFLFAFAVAIECIYHLKNQNAILPHCFLINLIQSFISGSKTVTALNGKISPGASDASYRRWLKEQGNVEPELPDGDFDLYLDNVGKYIKKNYRVDCNMDNTPTVITAAVTIALQPPDDESTGVQFRNDLMPCHWQTGLTETDVQAAMEEKKSACEKDFTECRYAYIESLFIYLSSSHDMDKEIVIQMQKLDDAHLTRICNDCGALYPKRKQKCDDCGGLVSANVPDDDKHTYYVKPLPKYFSIGEVNVDNAVPIKQYGPYMRNPNSYESMRVILSSVADQLFTENRVWAFVGADGMPYTLMRRIIRDEPAEFGRLSLKRISR